MGSSSQTAGAGGGRLAALTAWIDERFPMTKLWKEQVAEYYAQPQLKSGALVEILAGYKTEGYDISVVFRQQKRVAPKLRVFVDFLVELFKAPPWVKPGAGPARKRVARAQMAAVGEGEEL